MDDRKQEASALRAVVYVRISDDPEGTERGVDRQETDCRAYATGQGMTVPYLPDWFETPALTVSLGAGIMGDCSYDQSDCFG